MKRMSWVMCMLVLCMVLAGCPVSSSVPVPNVVGQTQAIASDAISNAGLTVGTITQAYSSTIVFGSVISQDPASGTPVGPGFIVTLTVSGGPELVIVPNVVGQTQSAASTTITAANLTVGTITEAYSTTVAIGSVISQDTIAGAAVSPGTAVALTVSKGPPPPVTEETVLLQGGVPLVMVWCPSGSFQMGYYPGEQDSYMDEYPQHTVTLGGYWMAKYELTKRQWKAVMGTTPWNSSYELADLDSPAVCVSWNDAQSFLIAVNSYTGKTFHLPSEAQWEYACRGATTTRFYWGDDPSYTAIGDYAWYYDNAWSAGQQYAHVVGQKLPNAFGLYDMSGNVWEWCEDDSHDDYTGAPTGGQAWVDSPRGSYRVLRGGSWFDYRGVRSCRSAYRSYNLPVNAEGAYGFRVAWTP